MKRCIDRRDHEARPCERAGDGADVALASTEPVLEDHQRSARVGRRNHDEGSTVTGVLAVADHLLLSGSSAPVWTLIGFRVGIGTDRISWTPVGGTAPNAAVTSKGVPGTNAIGFAYGAAASWSAVPVIVCVRKV